MTRCRSCNKTGLVLVLSLGETSLANALLTEEQLSKPEPTFPLDLAFCPHCTLVQILESVSPEQLFSEYLYFSSYSETVVASARGIAQRVLAEHPLNADSLVVEIASNDGYLLQYYKKSGIPVLGIEPAVNIARVAEQERGIRTRSAFFGRELAEEMYSAGEQADVIHANNVLAHVPDLNGVVIGLRRVVKPRGVIIIEVPYVKPMFDHVEFDTIYHEHLCYFSLTALDQLLARHGLLVESVEQLPIHGGSLRLFVRASEGARRDETVQALLAEEEAWGIRNAAFYEDFAHRVEALKVKLTRLLAGIKMEGKQIVGYGAAAKGNTLLNTFGIGKEVLDYVVDRNPYKQGLYLPGTHIPVLAPETVDETHPDYVLILPWNIRDEVMAQMARIRDWGGCFIVPVPNAEVL